MEKEKNEDLIKAVRKDDAAAAKTLLSKGADGNAKDKYGYYALELAASNGHAEIVKFLLDNGANVNAEGESGHSLTNAARKGHTETVKILLDNGADVNIKTKYGGTGLMTAAFEGHAEIVKLLLDNGADVNVKTWDDETALIYAAQNGHTEIAKVLLDNGADVNTKDNGGKTPLMWAESKGHTEIIKALRAKGANSCNREENLMRPQKNDKEAMEYYNKGVTSSQRGLYDDAIMEYEDALKCNPSSEVKILILTNLSREIWVSKNNYIRRDGASISDEEYKDVIYVTELLNHIISYHCMRDSAKM